MGARETVIDVTWARVTDVWVSRRYMKTVLGNGGGRRILDVWEVDWGYVGYGNVRQERTSQFGYV